MHSTVVHVAKADNRVSEKMGNLILSNITGTHPSKALLSSPELSSDRADTRVSHKSCGPASVAHRCINYCKCI
jgi:hypothetical protein